MAKKEMPSTEEASEKAEKTEKHSALASIARQINPKIVSLAVIALIVGILVGQVAMPGLGIGLMALPQANAGNAQGQTVDLAALQEKVEQYLNENVLIPQGVEGKVKGITPLDDDFYTVDIDILSEGQVLATETLYLTKSGNAISGTVLFLDEPLEVPDTEPGAETSYLDVVPQASAELQAFIVSQCPYGLQMQRILAPIATGLGQNIKVRYIGSVSGGQIVSMHGDAEAQENLRQICIREEQADKYWPYVSEYIKKGSTEAAIAAAKVDAAKLDACMSDSSKGLAYAQADFDLMAQFGASASPALVLNGVPVSEFEFAAGNGMQGSERSAENVKQLLCYGFASPPAACNASLSTEVASTGLSEQYSGGSSTGGSCN